MSVMVVLLMTFIWNAHPLKQHLENLYINENETLWMLADSGYPLRPWMMTPILHAASGSREEYYTYLHIRARNCIERCIGVLKARWRCLLVHRVLHYEPEVVGYIINACVILHNIANRARLPVPELSPLDLQREHALQLIRNDAENIGAASTSVMAGRAVRDALVNRLWAEREHELE
ncbi:Putative nuclease HARBI1 [Eumeta japonica]|uniref:Nuclease HARBI1 n=1 Tax=Eumeta variegata TaxID=151549 RepID=A0A4C1ZPS6_EUMVA|nr:Putative nuclease HARBI1 [Eumeta japonica]